MVDKECQKILKDPEKFHKVAKAMFEAADTNHSGRIDVYELLEVSKKICLDLHVCIPTIQEILETMKQLDTDKSKDLDLKEFEAYALSAIKATAENHEEY